MQELATITDQSIVLNIIATMHYALYLVNFWPKYKKITYTIMCLHTVFLQMRILIQMLAESGFESGFERKHDAEQFFNYLWLFLVF